MAKRNQPDTHDAYVTTSLTKRDKRTAQRLAKIEGVRLAAWIREAIVQRIRTHQQ